MALTAKHKNSGLSTTESPLCQNGIIPLNLIVKILLKNTSKNAQIWKFPLPNPLLPLASYYPFGMVIEGRSASSGNQYRYGFNGQEEEKEISGNESHTTAEYWMYDTRLGHRWNIDPIQSAFQSSYVTFDNNPIFYADPDGALAWHPTGVESSDFMKLVADAGDDECSLRDYLNTIGVKYTEVQFQELFNQIQCNWDEGKNIEGLALYSDDGLFNNLVGTYLMSRMKEDLTWGNNYYPDVICGGAGWKCSPVSANRTALATKFVYGENSEEYQKLNKKNIPCGYVGYNQFQANFIPGHLYEDGETGDQKYDRLKGNYCGLTYEQRLQAGCGAIEYAGVGTIQNDVWKDITPGAIIGLTIHSAIFTRYAYDQSGTVIGLYYWDDHNCEQFVRKSSKSSVYPRAGANFY